MIRNKARLCSINPRPPFEITLIYGSDVVCRFLFWFAGDFNNRVALLSIFSADEYQVSGFEAGFAFLWASEIRRFTPAL